MLTTVLLAFINYIFFRFPFNVSARIIHKDKKYILTQWIHNHDYYLNILPSHSKIYIIQIYSFSKHQLTPNQNQFWLSDIR